jgi:pimeloyl-ACP methyl ester carboxylesterase
VTTDADRESGVITLGDGRNIGYADFGSADATPVLWCHGGPGSRLEAKAIAPVARDAGLRIVGIDRPGYGRSTPQPGRRIGDWVPEALAVADALEIDRFVSVGVSTGGGYALALAAQSPRVIGTVACCALTDMRWSEGKSMMHGPQIEGIWNSASREEALAIATDAMGADGSKLLAGAAGPELPAADLALLANPEWLAGMMGGLREMFAHGVAGYTDDRLADGPGWGSFDVAAIRCPVTVIHGGRDTIVPVAHAHYTARIVPGAKLVIFPELGHFSIAAEIVGAVRGLLG